MRIISGKARGTNLYTLEGKNTRPTLDRVKESFFNIINNDIYDSKFLDVFSGSGAIGLEAASRGAKKVILCDNSKEAINIINKNIQKTHLEEQTIIHNIDYKELLKNKVKDVQNYIYIDPPYESNYGIEAIQILAKNTQIIDENTICIIETDTKERYIEEIEKLNLKIIDERKYGRAILIFIKIANVN